MAKINPVKLKQDADKLEKGGRLDQAIALYRQVIDDNPRDWNVINKLGDLYAKLNKFREASEQYAKVADFYAKDGFHLKAIAIWKKINKLDATALEPYLNLAELYGKQGLMMEAKSQYQYVVDEYIKRGKTRDAGEVLKKMADIDPGDLKIRSKLADLYTREGNSARAVDEHIAIAEELNKKGHLAEALQVLEKGLKIDPKSSRLRVHIARVHLVQKNFEKAVHVLEEAVHQAPNDPEILARLGEAYLGAKKVEEGEAIFKRLLELNPEDEDSRLQMGRVYLLQGQYDRAFEEMLPVVDKLVERRDAERAATLLQAITQKNPSHVKTLLKLVELYRQLQKDSAVSATYSQLTEAYLTDGQLEQAASVLETLVARDPQNQQHKSKLDFVRGKLGVAPRPSAGSGAPPELGLIEEEFDLSISDEAPAFVATAAPTSGAAASFQAPTPSARPATAAPPPRPAIEVSGPLSDEDREFIEEHLAEGKVFRKYGLVDKAADQFESVVARFPDNLEARQELREVFKEKGQADRAAEQCLAVADIFRLRGDEAAAAAQEAEAERLAPAPVAPVAAPRAAAPAPVALEPEAEEEEIHFGSVEEEPALEQDSPGLSQDEEIALDVEEGATPPFAAQESSVPDMGTSEDLVPGGGDDPLSGMGGGDHPATPLGGTAHPTTPLGGGAQPLDLGGDHSLDAMVGADDNAAPSAGAEEPSTPLAGGNEEAEFDLGVEMTDEQELPTRFLDDEPAPPPAPAEGEFPGLDAPLAEEGIRFEETSFEEVLEPAPPPPPPPPVAAVARPAPLSARPAPPAPPAVSGIPPELARVLDEVESYVSLGFVDDAKEALREVGIRFPGHPSLLEKIAELGLEEAVEEPAGASMQDVLADDPLGALGMESSADESFTGSSSSEPGLGSAEDLVGLAEPSFDDEPLAPPADAWAAGTNHGGADELLPSEMSLDAMGGAEPGGFDPGGIDLGDELGELFGAQSAVEEPEPEPGSTDLGDAGLADIFKEFKKGVDKQLGKEDYDTRYNLGIAYKEMGLIDEAIAEFQLAAKDEGRLLECSSMLGICFLDKGMPKLAVKWFERGLKAPGRNEEEYAALRYDLAMAHEAAGDVDTALSLFTDLYGQDANFRDVAAKVRELRGALG
jgi:tetratricopeptide (TPR) repeat protein